ncbi:MAG: glycine cleavage system protein T [Micrococcales bacterium 70-64]|nr:glycine cleavage system aminomethyltransferase GcvT [Leifsonia sp.]ODU66013.1 MAG: glycine cleavage system protein T [Leifsonia sp. SCN 70-46]OJX84640.1 MAG: glycine cleavage system protein T [Micrococcales bacterium 70-64]
MSDPRQSPLHDLHVEAGASFTDFAGWLMPVRYSSDLAEHHAVRTAAGIFDISHMAEIRVTGPDAAAFLDFALAGLISAVKLGKAKYSLILEESGGILDDLIVYHDREAEYYVVANAGNRDVVVAALQDRSAGFDVTVTDLTDEVVLIAVQGPNARDIVAAVVDLPELTYYSAAYAGDVLVARTGYTGEDGYELYVAVEDAAPLWRALVAAGASRGLVPAGLASRDTLRLEAGMPLYGHELGLDTLPAQAGLGRVPNLTKDFVGRQALEAGPADDARVLVGLVSEGKRAGRAGYALLSGDDEVGVITSGALSPTLGHPIAMAYVDPAVSAPGTQLDIDVRGSRIAATVVALPFYKREA